LPDSVASCISSSRAFRASGTARASPFTREYKRLFGCTPLRDARALRETDAASALHEPEPVSSPPPRPALRGARIAPLPDTAPPSLVPNPLH